MKTCQHLSKMLEMVSDVTRIDNNVVNIDHAAL